LNSRSISFTILIGRQVSFGVRQLAEFDGQVIMARGRIGFAREQLPARGDALIGQRGAPGVVRDEVIEVKTRAGKLPGGRGVVGVRLKLRLRAMIFRPGAPGKNQVARFVGENDSDDGGKKNCGGQSVFCRAPGQSWN
jgi:hypothetical protein